MRFIPNQRCKNYTVHEGGEGKQFRVYCDGTEEHFAEAPIGRQQTVICNHCGQVKEVITHQRAPQEHIDPRALGRATGLALNEKGEVYRRNV